MSFKTIQPKSRIRGFTLVELVVTLAVAAILATIAVPAFNNTLESIRARRATESMVAALYNAKSEAIKRNTFVNVVFKISNSGATWCYGLTTDATCDCTTAGSCRVGGVTGVETVVSNAQFRDISANPSATTFSFNPLRGTIDPQGNVEFTSAGQGYQSRAVVSAKGRIKACSNTGAGYIGAFKPC